MSNNGVVSKGSWELIHIANSIMLDISGEKRLYNHQFIDNGLMILKLDGHSTEFFVLANQNVIADLDVENYLISKYSNPISQEKRSSLKSLYAKEQQLSDGRMLQFLNDLDSSDRIPGSEAYTFDGDSLLFYGTLRGITFECDGGILIMDNGFNQLWRLSSDCQ